MGHRNGRTARLSEHRDGSRLQAALVLLLGAAMVAATYQQAAVAVLSSYIIDDLAISRSELGLVFAVFSIAGGVSSIAMGSLADRNATAGMLCLFLAASLGLIAASVAPAYLALLGASAVGGVALGAGNPVTNRIVADHFRLANRGFVIGLKQSGPPVGIFLAGVALPALAVLFGWRVSIALGALLPMAGFVAALLLMPRARRRREQPAATDSADKVDVDVWLLAAVGLLVALGVSAITAFLPLFAEQGAGLTPTMAGLVAALMGVAGVVGRIFWGTVSGKRIRTKKVLMTITTVSVVAVVAIGGSTGFGRLSLWSGSILAGLTILAWHAVAWLSLINHAGGIGIGRLSGLMQIGASAGFAIGPLLAGIVVDATRSYEPMWAIVGAILCLATLLTTRLNLKGSTT